MANTRDVIEQRFRRGSNGFFWIAGLSALGTTALYKGWMFKPIASVCLATPMVLDVIARAIDPRLFGQQIHYYCYIFSLILAGLFLFLGVLSRFGSHTGRFLRLGAVFGGFARIGSWLGLAHLVGSRLFYFAGIVIYTLDGVLAFAIENLIGSQFTELRLAVLLNLGFHAVMLVQLLYGFVAGLERESKAVAKVQEGNPTV